MLGAGAEQCQKAAMDARLGIAANDGAIGGRAAVVDAVGLSLRGGVERQHGFLHDADVAGSEVEAAKKLFRRRGLLAGSLQGDGAGAMMMVGLLRYDSCRV